ncbi:hypothetical protein Q7A53_10345 [Halobacillus rhizosphaerae]|uniref:hypothetical protein n=1 Tax=Halobacillus rhizosphaerae TaxID=3064889 RepID=UPI00398AD571
MRLHRYGLLFVTLIIVCVLGGCDTDNNDDEVESTNLADVKVQGIQLGSSRDELIHAFGKPDFVEKIKQPKSTYYIYGETSESYDIDFKVVDDQVKRYFMTKDIFENTYSHLIGQKKADVLRQVGDHYYERQDTGADVMGYSDKEHNRNIEFIFEGNVVLGILVSSI